MTGLAARAVACLGALGIIGLATLPPEHVHLGADHDDHAAPEVHRHFQPHQPSEGQTHVEPPDADATYISDAFLVPTPASLHVPDAQPVVLAVAPAIQPLHVAWYPSGRDLRVHDPPWARDHVLRGPPSQLA